MSDHRPGNGSGQAAFRDHLPNAFRRAFFKVNRNQRAAFSIFAEQAAQKGLRRGADVAEAKFTFFSGSGAADAVKRFFKLLQQQRCFAKQDCARRSQAHMMTCSFKDARTQSRLQLFDRAAQRRLGDVQPAGSARETQILGHGLKISEMPKFHRIARDNSTASR